MTALYREFPMRTPAMWPALVAFVKANAEAVLGRGSVLRIIVTEDEKRRTREQNRFYFGSVLRDIAEQAWVDGNKFSKDVWHEHFASQYLPKVEIVTPFGEIITRRKSTTELNVSEFSDYLYEVQAFASGQLGVVFE